jgi:hypothetical protein
MHEGSLASIATTRGRLRLGWEPRTGALNQFDVRFRIRAKFPGLKDRVELLLSDEEDSINQQDIKAAQNRELSANESAVVAVQYKKNEDDKLSYRVGFGRGSQVYTRARFNDFVSLSEDTKFYYYAETNYYSGDKFGFEVDGVLSSQLTQSSAFEFSNSFQYRDNRKDWYWRHEMRYLILDKDDTSYLFTAMVDGLSEPNYRTESILVSARYKQRALCYLVERGRLQNLIWYCAAGRNPFLNISAQQNDADITLRFSRIRLLTYLSTRVRSMK